MFLEGQQLGHPNIEHLRLSIFRHAQLEVNDLVSLFVARHLTCVFLYSGLAVTGMPLLKMTGIQLPTVLHKRQINIS